MNLSDIPNHYEYTLISESTIYKIGEMIAENKLSESGFYDLSNEEGIPVYRCPSCKRIYLEENGVNSFTSYMPEK